MYFFLIWSQDEENTNYSIHLPRSAFDRQATGEIVLRAVRSLGIDAFLNKRNDICVSSDKISNMTLLPGNCLRCH